MIVRSMVILRALFFTAILSRLVHSNTQIELGNEYSDHEDLHRSLSETLSETFQMQNALYEFKTLDHSEIINQMSNQVSDLTIQVNSLQRSKESLENKVNSLEAEMDCIMGRSGSCDTSKCMNGGTLIAEEGACVCRKGYSGEHCEKDVNECVHDDDPCSNNGRCVNTYGSFTCECEIDYYGPSCQSKYDDCDPNPCKNGRCVSPGRRVQGRPHFQCVCNTGWNISTVEYTCSQDINECEEQHLYCDELAVDCTNTEGSFKCTCPPGYFGSGRVNEGGCVEIADCSSDPCSHGRCRDLDIGYECECETGWTGWTCGVRLTGWCSKKPCKNNGRCIVDGETFHCECQAGYNGQYCERSESVCERVECRNGGTCQSVDGVQHTCLCRPGFAGTFCEGLVEACDGNVCQNDGTCVPTNSHPGYECRCQNGFEGQFCQDKIMYELTPCGQEGAVGPVDRTCTVYYRHLQQSTDGLHVNVVSGIQNAYIPQSGTYKITARGSSGGSDRDNDRLGGFPVVITATFRLSPGYLKIAVGQEGQCHKFVDDLSGKRSKSTVCGGGGGTFVVSKNEPLLIAGGGGGSGDNGPGINASKTIEGTYHIPNSNVFGGNMGDGGKSCPRFGGAGGAGFITNGEDGFSDGEQVRGTGGNSWPDLRGGTGPDTYSEANHGRTAFGGFGGGGRGTWCPGGGGGYSGGAGKCSRTGKGTAHKGGGGGGSLVSSDALSRILIIANRPGPGRVKVVRLNDE